MWEEEKYADRLDRCRFHLAEPPLTISMPACSLPALLTHSDTNNDNDNITNKMTNNNSATPSPTTKGITTNSATPNISQCRPCVPAGMTLESLPTSPITPKLIRIRLTPSPLPFLVNLADCKSWLCVTRGNFFTLGGKYRGWKYVRK